MEKVIIKAKEALRNSYSPYSNFPVGAAVEVSDGTIFLGTNVENIVNGASICAEQNAINAAISNGYKGSEIKRIAIFAPTKNLTYPCSLCRQVFVEFFNEKTEIIVTNGEETKITNINELVPFAFTNEGFKK